LAVLCVLAHMPPWSHATFGDDDVPVRRRPWMAIVWPLASRRVALLSVRARTSASTPRWNA